MPICDQIEQWVRQYDMPPVAVIRSLGVSVMDIRIIKSPSAGTMEILKHRIGFGMEESIAYADTVGLSAG